MPDLKIPGFENVVANPNVPVRSGSIAEPAGMYGQSQYSQNLPYSMLADTPDVRAGRQKGFDVIGNMLGQSVVTTLGQTLEGIGAIMDIPEMAVTKIMGGEYQYDNALANLGSDLMAYSQEQMPIYADSKATPWSPERWAQMFPSVFSTLSLMLPGMGIAKGVGMIGRAGRWGKLLTESTGTILGGMAMRHGENWMESKQMYDQELKKWMDEGYDETSAKEAASQAAHTTYNTNWWNAAFDILQLGSAMNLFKGVKWSAALGPESRLGQVLDNGYSATRAKGAFANSNKLSRTSLFAAGISRPFIAQSTEGIEEALNYHASKEGEREAKITLGEELNDRDKKDTWDRFQEDIFSSEGLEAGVWGIAGGALFQGAGNLLTSRAGLQERIKATFGQIDPKVIKASTDIQEIKNRSELIAQNMAIINSPTATTADKKRARKDVTYNLFSASQRAGTLDMLIEDLKRPSYVQSLNSAFGSTPEQVTRNAAILASDLNSLKEKIDRYEGASINAYLRSFSEKGYSAIADTDIVDKSSLADNGDLSTAPLRAIEMGTTNPQIVRAFKKGNRFGFVEPAVAEFLAKSEFDIETNTEIALEHTKEYLDFIAKKDFTIDETNDKVKNQRKALYEAVFKRFAAEQVKEQYLQSIAEIEDAAIDDKYHKLEKETRIAALDKEIAKRLKEEEEIKAFYDAAVSLVFTPQEQQRQAEAKEKDWTAIKTEIDKDIADAKNLPVYDHMVEVVSSQVSNEWLAKQQMEILKDPDEFVELEVSRFKKLAAAKVERLKKLAAVAKEQKEVNDLKAALIDPKNEAFKKEVELFVTGNKDKSDDQLKVFFDQSQNALTDSKFSPTTMAEFNSTFPKDEWVRHNAILKGVEQISTTRGTIITGTLNQKGAPNVNGPIAQKGTALRKAQAYDLILKTVDHFEYTYKARMEDIADLMQGLKSKSINPAGDLFQEEKLRILQEMMMEVVQMYPLIGVEVSSSLADVTMADYMERAISEAGEHFFFDRGMYRKPGTPKKVGEPMQRLFEHYDDFVDAMVEEYQKFGTVNEAFKNLDALRATFKEKLDAAMNEAASEINESASESRPVIHEEEEPDPAFVNSTDPLEWKKPSIAPHAKSDTDVLFQMTIGYPALVLDLNGNPVRNKDGHVQLNPAYNIDPLLTDPLEATDSQKNKSHLKPGTLVTVHESSEYIGGLDFKVNGIKVGYVESVSTLDAYFAAAVTRDKSPGSVVYAKKHHESRLYVHDMYNRWKKGDRKVPLQFEVAKSVSPSGETKAGWSGGLTWGEINVTKKKDASGNWVKTFSPFLSSFGKDALTRKQSRVYLTTFFEHDYYVMNESGEHALIENQNPDIVIPTEVKQKNPSAVKNVANTNNYNGQTFALVPTNNYDINGKHIYVPVLMRTRMSSDPALKVTRADNTQVSPFEEIMETLVNPSHNIALWMDMFAMVGARVPTGVTNPQENQDVLNQFYTADNIRAILQRWVFTDYTEKSGPSSVYKVPFAIDVFTRPDGQRSFKVQFNGKEMFMNLIRKDKDGKLILAGKLRAFSNLKQDEFNDINFEELDLAETASALQSQARKDNPALVAEMFAHVDKKPIRVDKRKIREHDKKYSGFVVRDGKLEIGSYDNYPQYLSENEILTTHVHSIKIGGGGPSNTRHTFFTQQEVFLRNATPVAASNSGTKGGKEEPIITTPGAPVYVIDKTIETASNKYQLSKDNSTYVKAGSPFQRVSTVLFGKKEKVSSPALFAGGIVDILYKYALEPLSFEQYVDSVGDALSMGGLSTKTGTGIWEQGQKLQKLIASRGEVIVGTSVRVGSDEAKIAGEMDVLVRKANGKYKTYDFKSRKKAKTNDMYAEPITLANGQQIQSEKRTHTEQMRAYADLFAIEHPGKELDEAEIIFINLNYTGNEDNMVIKSASINNIAGNETVPLDLKDPTLKRLPLKQPPASSAPAASAPTKVQRRPKVGIADPTLAQHINNQAGPGSAAPPPTASMTLGDHPGFQDVNDLFIARATQSDPRALNAPLDYFTDKDAGSRYRQNRYTSFVTDVLLQILNKQHVKNPEKGIRFEQMGLQLTGAIESLLEIEYDRLEFGKLNQDEMNAANQKADFYNYILDHLHIENVEALKEEVPENGDAPAQKFVGYYRLALGDLSSMGITKVSLNVSREVDIELKDGEILPYTSHFKDNWFAKLNPKSTIRPSTKIFLATIPVYEMKTVEGKSEFRVKKDPVTGMPLRYSPNETLHLIAQLSEDVPSDMMMEHFTNMALVNPVFKSIMDALDNLKGYYESIDQNIDNIEGEKKRRFRQLIAVVGNQRRAMRGMILQKNTKGGVNLNVVDSARNGITVAVIRDWENRFQNKMFTEFFIKEETPSKTTFGGFDIKTKRRLSKPQAIVKNEGNSQPLTYRKYDSYAAAKYDIYQQIVEIYKRAEESPSTIYNLEFLPTSADGITIGDYTLTNDEMAALISSAYIPENVRIDKRLQSSVREDPFDQIWHSVKSALINTGNSVVDASGKVVEKKADDYKEPTYRLIAAQFDRLGINLHEQPEESWKVLSDINTYNGVKKVYKYTEKVANSFEHFLQKILADNILVKLQAANLGGIESNNGDILIDEPFEEITLGINKLSRMVRPYFTKYTNDTIRTMAGLTEYTYTPSNGLSILLDKINAVKRAGGGKFLQEMAKTDLLKHNIILQKMLSDPEKVTMSLRYMDGLRNEDQVIEPETITAIGNIIVQYGYYAASEPTGDNKRSNGLYMTSFSDSSVAPLIEFEKRHLRGLMIETIKDGKADYSFKMNRSKEYGSMYAPLLGSFRGEMARILKTQQAWEAIEALPEDQRAEHAATYFKAGKDYLINGQGVPYAPGTGMNLYMLGEKMFDENQSGIYEAPLSKTDPVKGKLKREFVTAEGELNLEAVDRHFDTLIDGVVDAMIEDEYNRLSPFIDRLFNSSIKEGKIRVNSGFMDSRLLDYIKKTLNEMQVQTVDGQILTGADLNIGIPLEGRREVLKRDNPTWSNEDITAEINRILEVRKRLQSGVVSEDGQDRNNTYKQALIKTLVADYVMNNFVFLSTFQYVVNDPANFAAGRPKGMTKYDMANYHKRSKKEVSPGNQLTVDKRFSSKKIVFRDLKAGKITVTVDPATLTNEERVALAAVTKHLTIVDNKYPFNWREYITQYNAARDKEAVVEGIKVKMDAEVFDGGSIVTLREGLFRLVAKGAMTDSQAKRIYERLHDPNITSDEAMDLINAKVLKYVISGTQPVVFGDDLTGDINSTENTYGKQAEMWLIPAIARQYPVLNTIMENLEELENAAIGNSGRTSKDFYPGFRLAPNSSEKIMDAMVFDLFNEDGSVNKIPSTFIKAQPYDNFREQIETPDEDNMLASEANQGKKYKYLNIPASNRYGAEMFSRYTIDKDAYPIDELEDAYTDEDGDPLSEEDFTQGGNGLTINGLYNIEVGLTEQTIKRRFHKLMDRIGIGWSNGDKGKAIDSLDKFLQVLKEHAVSRGGFDGNALAFLQRAANDLQELDFPIDFTPQGKAFQSLIASLMENTFKGVTLPGGTFAMTSGMMFTRNSTKISDKNLKGYREDTKLSPVFDSVESLEKTYAKSEIVPGSIERLDKGYRATLRTFNYAEVAISWNLRDQNNKLLDYDIYVNKDGTIKTYTDENGVTRSMIDEEVLKIVASRIPNTGPNATAVLKIVRFHPPYTDTISINPDLVATLGADFDFDKLFVYTGHLIVERPVYKEVVYPDGSVEDVIVGGSVKRIKGYVHHSQLGAENVNSDINRREYIRNYVRLNNQEYKDLTAGLKYKKGKDRKVIKAKLVAIENAEYEKMTPAKWRKIGFYGMQSDEQIENGLIDLYHIIYGNYKSLEAITKPLTSNFLNNLASKKVVGGNFNYGDLNENKGYVSITSPTTFSLNREDNSQRGRMVGIAANMQNMQAMAQLLRLYQKKGNNGINMGVRFADNKGALKTENIVQNKNGQYVVPDDDTVIKKLFNPYTTLMTENGVEYTMEEMVTDFFEGRSRLDRIYTTLNNGQRVEVSDFIKSLLQAALDNQKDPIISRAHITTFNSNASLALALLGYIDEIVPLVNSEAVKNYETRFGTAKVFGDYVNETQLVEEMVREYATAAGIGELAINGSFINVDPVTEKETKRHLTDAIDYLLIYLKDSKPEHLSEIELNAAKQKELNGVKDKRYYAVQLMALQNFYIAHKLGQDILTMHLATNAESKGLAPDMVQVMAQEETYENLFKWEKVGKKGWQTGGNISMLGNVYHLDNDFLGGSKNKKKRPATRNLYALAHHYGVKAVKRIFKDKETLFFSISNFMDEIYYEAWKEKHDYRSERFKNWVQPGKDRSKLFLDFVSFIYSDPYLYEQLFTTEEFDAFKENARFLLAKPTIDTVTNPEWKVFTKAESLAKTLQTLADDPNGKETISEYEILQVLKPYISNVNYRPSTVSMTKGNDYREQIDERIAKSIVALYTSMDKDLNSLAKKLIVYAYMTGGINSPNSFVKHIPYEITKEMGLGERLRGRLKTIKEHKAYGFLRDTFLLQFYQHEPEMLKPIDTKYLVAFDDIDTFTDEEKEKNANYSKKNGSNPFIYKDSHIDRRVVKLTSQGALRYAGRTGFTIIGAKGKPMMFVPADVKNGIWMQVDTLGDKRNNVKEYSFPVHVANGNAVPGESIFHFNLSESTRRVPNMDSVKPVVEEDEVTMEGIEAMSKLGDVMSAADSKQTISLLRRDSAYYSVFDLGNLARVYKNELNKKEPKSGPESSYYYMAQMVKGVFGTATIVPDTNPQPHTRLMDYDMQTKRMTVYTIEFDRYLSKAENPDVAVEKAMEVFIHEGIHMRLNPRIWEAITKTPLTMSKEYFRHAGQFKDAQKAIENMEKLLKEVIHIIKTDPTYKNEGEKLRLYEEYLHPENKLSFAQLAREKEINVDSHEVWFRGFLGDKYEPGKYSPEILRYLRVAEAFAHLSDSKFKSLMNSVNLDGTRSTPKKGKGRNALVELWKQFVAFLETIFNGKTYAESFKELQEFFDADLKDVVQGSAMHGALWQFYKMDDTLPSGRRPPSAKDMVEAQTPPTTAALSFTESGDQLQAFEKERVDRRSKRMGDKRMATWKNELMHKYPLLNITFEAVNDELVIPAATIAEVPNDPKTNSEYDVSTWDLSTPFVSFADSESVYFPGIPGEEAATAENPYKEKILVGNFVDPYIESIENKIEALKLQKSTANTAEKKTLIEKQIAGLTIQHNNLVETATAGVLHRVAKQQLQLMEKDLEVSSIDNAQMLDNMTFLNAWRNFYALVPVNNLTEDQNKNFQTVVGRATELFNKYVERLYQETKNKLSGYGVTQDLAEAIDKMVKDIGMGAFNFQGLSFGESPIEYAVNYIIRQQSVKYSQEADDFNQRLKAKTDKLGKDWKPLFVKGEDGTWQLLSKRKPELLQKLHQLRNEYFEANKILSIWQAEIKELYAQLRDAQTTGDAGLEATVEAQIKGIGARVKEHKTKNPQWIDYHTYMKDNFDFTPIAGSEAEMMKEFAAFKEDLRKGFVLEGSTPEEQVRQEKTFNRWVAQYDPSTFMKWLRGEKGVLPNDGARFFRIDPKAIHNNPVFDNLSTAQKEMYDFFVDEYMEAISDTRGNQDPDEYTLDKAIAEFIFTEKPVMNVVAAMSKNGWEWMKDTVTVKHVESNMDNTARGPISDQEMYKLRIKTVKDFTRISDGVFYEKDAADLKASVKKSIAEGRMYWKDGILHWKESDKVVDKYVDTETNPFEILRKFKLFSLDFKNKKAVEGLLHSLSEISANVGVLKTSPTGGLKFNAFNKFVPSADNRIQGRIKHTIDAFLYNKRKDAYGGIAGAVEPGKRNFSGEKLIDAINSLTRARNMGLNPFSAIGNLSLGTVNNFIYAGGQQFFTEKELGRAYLILRGSTLNFFGKVDLANKEAIKAAKIMKRWNILGDVNDLSFQDDTSIEKLLDNLYVMQTRGEFMNQGAVTVATMLATKTKDKHGKERSVWDVIEMSDSGQLSVNKDFEGTEYADFNKMQKLFAGIIQINKQIHGDYDPLNPIVFKKNVYGRALMLFRGWLPQAIQQRFGSKRKDLVLSEAFGREIFTEGRWVTLKNILFKNKDQGDIITNIGALMGSILLQTFSNKRIKFAGEVSELDRVNLNMITKELWWLTLMAVVTATLTMLATGEDDDEEEKNAMSVLKFLYNQTSRIESELWFFYSVSDFKKFVKDIVPQMSTWEQMFRLKAASERLIMEPEKDIYQRGFRKGTSKWWKEFQMMFPGTKQVQNGWSVTSQIFDDDPYK